MHVLPGAADGPLRKCKLRSDGYVFPSPAIIGFCLTFLVHQVVHPAKLGFHRVDQRRSQTGVGMRPNVPAQVLHGTPCNSREPIGHNPSSRAFNWPHLGEVPRSCNLRHQMVGWFSVDPEAHCPMRCGFKPKNPGGRALTSRGDGESISRSPRYDAHR